MELDKKIINGSRVFSERRNGDNCGEQARL